MTAKKEPVRLSAVIVALLQIGLVTGAFTISQANISLAGQSVDVLATLLTPPLMGLVQWIGAWWLRQQVSPAATTKPMAEALKTITLESPETVPLAAQKAAGRVLGAPLE